MPFVKRVVTPKYICRKKQNNAPGKSHSTPNGGVVATTIQDHELETITNITLSNALRQLASILLISNEIFAELNKELETINDRSCKVKQRIDKLSKTVEESDPKLVPVPQSDLITFVAIKQHFKQKQELSTQLFTPETRTDTLKEMYDAAAKTPVLIMDEIDSIMGQPRRRSSDAFLCTPVLGALRHRMQKKVDLEIEARKPSEIDKLRMWTSIEALGDITVTPDGLPRIADASTIHSSTLIETTSCNDSTEANASVARSNILNDSPIDHQLPSPEEQQDIIAKKYPAVTIKVDTSGKQFDRMCTTRKSLLHVQTSQTVEENTDTMRRRTRSRKPRGKRRNTIAGDGKEIAEAIQAETANTATDTETQPIDHMLTVPRSKSNDLLKRESGIERGSFRQSIYNTLQRGRNRWRQITLRTEDKYGPPLPIDKDVSDIDDFNINETLRTGGVSKRRQDRRLTHDRRHFYSSSECSTQAVVIHTAGASVKIRESSNIRRQRRNGLGKDEPNSSSGNWSASSESGRTSIGSEITTTTHPKSSTSSSSLNHHHPPSSGPPSSIISRRRFLNTSASSSVTSEGTATPDLQTDFHDEDGSSSVYSCDTEGYYTSFHVDSGLKTLKEEEPPTPNRHSSTTSFESSSNQTVIVSPENEYELFGRGSTSTTTSSAGTVCTAVLADQAADRNNAPSLPERKSSLTKLHRSGSSVSEYNLERSCSSSTVGSTLDGAGTIKRNGVLLQKGVAALVHQAKEELQAKRNESPDSGNNTSSSPVESNSNSTSSQQSQQGGKTSSEFECSESSDLECSDRLERMRTKTTINTSRIPSICVLTPSNSDDEGAKKSSTSDSSSSSTMEKEKDLPKVISIEYGSESHEGKLNSKPRPELPPFKDLQHFKKSTLLPLNTFIGRLKEALPSLKKSPLKEAPIAREEEDDFYDTGEYVTITDTNGSNKKPANTGIYYSNDVVKRNLATVLSGNLDDTAEYVSLNELPCNTGCDKNTNDNTSGKHNDTADSDKKAIDEWDTTQPNKGTKVTMNAHGQIVYNSDSLKRRKSHSTFVPGPYIKDSIISASVGTKGSPIPIQSVPIPSNPNVDNKSQLNQNQNDNKKAIKLNTTESDVPDSTTTTTVTKMQDISNSLSEDFTGYCPDVPVSKYIRPTYISSNYSTTTNDIKPFHINQIKRNFNPPAPFKPDDLNVAFESSQAPQADQFTPHKLRTTRQGFDQYFSPVPPQPGPSQKNPHYLADSTLVNESIDSNNFIKASPIEPSTKSNFQTSTPSKFTHDPYDSTPTRGLANEIRSKLRLYDNGIRSSGNSPINSGRSTPRGLLEQQSARTRHSWATNTEVSETCADRIKPKTSLMDFKRLLLEHGKSSTYNAKKSAVEQLTLSKNSSSSTANLRSPGAMNSSMKILDLSSSPKTFATRRMIRQGNYGVSSPVKGTAPPPRHISPRTGWRYNNLQRSDVISSAIPEVNSEEDSPNSATRKLQPTMGYQLPSVVDDKKIDMRNNIFLKSEENNFMKHEINQISQKIQNSALTRAQLQSERAKFLLGNFNNRMNSGGHAKTVVSRSNIPIESQPYSIQSITNNIASGTATAKTTDEAPALETSF